MKPGESLIAPRHIVVEPGYFEARSIPLVRGRYFDARDDGTAPRVIIVDERLAQRFWPEQDPIGRRMNEPQDAKDIMKTDENTRWLTVVGVAIRSPDDGGAGGAVVVVPPHGFAAGGRVWRRGVVPFRHWHLRGTAYHVTQRRREIGIRVALGSTGAGVVRPVLREGLLLAVAGLAVGVAGAVAVRKVVENEIYGVGALDPLVIGGVALLLAAVVLAASVFPARRAIRVEPMRVLNQQ